MQSKLCRTLLMTSVFMLTSIAEANDPHFAEAQKFFYESKQLQDKGVKSSVPKEYPSGVARQVQSQQIQYQQASPPNEYNSKTAIYLSFINEKYNGGAAASPSLRTSLGVAFPILNAKGGKTKGEFVILSDIRNASEWGRVRFYHRESVNIIRWNFTQLELFAGAGLGYGYGDLLGSQDRLFAPWTAGLFFNQIHNNSRFFTGLNWALPGILLLVEVHIVLAFLETLA